jgi:serine/threonine protein kinase
MRRYSSQIDSQIRETWIQNAVSAVAFIHQHSVIHGDISARNFLVADYLSLKLCYFAGSGIGNEMPPLVNRRRPVPQVAGSTAVGPDRPVRLELSYVRNYAGLAPV